MSVIIYKNQTIDIDNNESVLEALERAEFSIPSRCRVGQCHRCILQAEGFSKQLMSAPENVTDGLTPQQIQAGQFKSCQCYGRDIQQPLHLGLADNLGTVAKIIEKRKLSTQITQLKLATSLQWIAGQSVAVMHSKFGSRRYSAASCKQEGVLELHIQLNPQGKMSQWLHRRQVGEQLILDMPTGECIYHPLTHKKPLLLIGNASGLAPLIGVVKSALAHNHTQAINLIQLQSHKEAIYYQKEIKKIVRNHSHVTMHCLYPSISSEQHFSGGPSCKNKVEQPLKSLDTLTDFLSENVKALTNTGVFLAGDRKMLLDWQSYLILHGADRSLIRCEYFN